MTPTLTTQKDGPIETTGTPDISTDRVSDLVQQLVAAVATQAENAAQRERARAEAERRHQIENDRLQAELRQEREQLTATRDTLGVARANLVSLQTVQTELQGELRQQREQLTATREELGVVQANLVSARRELAEQQAEKAVLLGAVMNVRRAVKSAAGGTPPDPPDPPTPGKRPADVDRIDDAPVTDPDFATLLSLDAVMALDLEGVQTPAQAPLKLVNKTLVAAVEPRPTLGPGDHVAQLLAQLEEVYRSDLKSAVGTTDLVARLKANLNYAREVFARRADSAQSDGTSLFDRQLAVFLAARADSPFAHHLAIASKAPAALQLPIQLQRGYAAGADNRRSISSVS
jgi:hypothetical protein